jgi:hypothetical protein
MSHELIAQIESLVVDLVSDFRMGDNPNKAQYMSMEDLIVAKRCCVRGEKWRLPSPYGGILVYAAKVGAPVGWPTGVVGAEPCDDVGLDAAGVTVILAPSFGEFMADVFAP